MEIVKYKKAKRENFWPWAYEKDENGQQVYEQMYCLKERKNGTREPEKMHSDSFTLAFRTLMTDEIRKERRT